jgi:hypothetical protein
MKTIVAVLIVTISSIAVGQRKLAEDNPQWRQQTVERAFAEVSAGMYSSWSEKYLARLGDSAAPEIMKLVAARPLTQRNANTALQLVNMSFAYPGLIRHIASRTPTNTLVLLNYLDAHVPDSNTKSKINSARQRVQALPPVPQGGE